MSNEALLGILISLIVGIGGFLITTKRHKVNIIQKSKNGDNTISKVTIGNEIDNNKK